MNERSKGYLAFLIVFLALLLIGIIEALALEPNHAAEFQQQVSLEVSQAIKGRDGVVLWVDRKSQQKILFGNSRLASRYFLPGSLMKLVTAEAALKNGVRQQYPCTGQDHIGGRLHHCWTPQGHGELDLPQALAKSCNLYFAKLGTRLGWEAIVASLNQYHFSQNQGLSKKTDSPSPGLAELAIGDNPRFQVSPEEMAEFWNRYLEKNKAPAFQKIRQGLLRAASEGTASQVGSSLKILAKTGTSDSLQEAYKTHGWFLGAYPAEKPRYALVIFLKDAHGFKEPTELAGKIFSIVQNSDL